MPEKPRTEPSAAAAWRTGAWTAGVAVAVNLVVFGAGRIAGADMFVQPPGAPAGMSIGIAQLFITTVLPALAGTVLLVATRRRGVRAWRLLAVAGLAFGVITMAMPVLASATTVTTITLAAMHILTGLVWFVLVWRAAR